MKTIIKRPAIHYPIIFFYILAPIVNILMLSLFARVSAGVAVKGMFAAYGTLASIWLLTAPIVGIGLFFVHRVSWYIFLGHSAIILADYVVKWATKAEFYWSTITTSYNILMFTGNLILVGAIGYILQRDFRAPYFQALQRSFREHHRIPIHHTITMNSVQRKIDDLSETGCAVSGADIDVDLGATVQIEFKAGSLSIACSGEIMRKSDTGVGIRFTGLSRQTRNEIRQFIRNRFSLRNRVDLEVKWSNGIELTGKMFDISSGGCYMIADPGKVEVGLKGNVTIKVNGHSHTVSGSVAWINSNNAYSKPSGFGIKFDRKHNRIVKEIEKKKGRLELTR